MLLRFQCLFPFMSYLVCILDITGYIENINIIDNFWSWSRLWFYNPVLIIHLPINTQYKMAKVCIRLFQKLLEILSQPSARIHLIYFNEIPVNNTNNNAFVCVCVLYVHACVVWACIHVKRWACIYVSIESRSQVFLSHILPYFLRKGLFLSLDLTRLVSQLTSLLSLLGQWDTKIYFLLPARELQICNIVSYLTFIWCWRF